MSLTKQRQLELADPAIVEAIVRQVIQRISDQGTQSGNKVNASSDQLKVEDKVVTLETVRGKLEGITALVVNEQSIVTPAVKDELNSLGIKLEASQATESADSGMTNTFCVARLSNHFVAAEWLKEIGQPKICCGDDYEQLASNLGGEYSNTKTICFAAQPHVAVSVLNRHSKLRVAFGRSEKDIAEIKSTLDANVLVLDTVQSRKEQMSLIRLFVNHSKGAA